MTTRREFIEMGVLVSAVPLAAGSLASAATAAPVEGTLPYKIIFDERFVESVAFGREAQRRGARVHSIAGDITSLWFNELDAQWKAQPITLAGLTAQGPLFCLEMLARDQGMRVVYRAEHVCSGSATTHSVQGPQHVLNRLGDLAAAGANWPARIASVATQCPHEWGKMASVTTSGASHFAIQGVPETLVSWVIAPIDGLSRTSSAV
jgi:hypothetical protein